MQKNDCKEIIRKFIASREANEAKFTENSESIIHKLEQFIDYLLKWNQKINLIARSTEADIWNRHVLDSFQLLNFLPSNNSQILDLGSGSGFPAIIIAILTKNSVQLVESNQKKAIFLQTCSQFCQNTPIVYNSKIQDLANLEADFITSRALCSVNHILNYSFNLQLNNSVLLLNKGERAKGEIEEAEKFWKIEYNLFPSIVDSKSYIIKISKFSKIS